MLPSEVLLAARELVAGGWTRGTYARAANGLTTAAAGKGAVCFCTLGAISRASGPGEIEYDSALVFFKNANSVFLIASWNDAPTTTHLDVVLAFERAALLAMKEGR